MQIVLASKSPRRREILTAMKIKFEVITSEADEASGERDPERLVEELALRKARAVEARLTAEGRDLSDVLIIASDTVVYAGGEILGKPKDRADAERMLKILSGSTHTVSSGIALIRGGQIGVSHDTTEVAFDRLSDDALAFYLSTDEPYDKAGAYAIQGIAAAWIKGVRGDPLNVIGLPVHEMCALFRKTFGVDFYTAAQGTR